MTAPGPAEPGVIKVVVVDDHEVVRAGFAGLLATQPDFRVVGTAADGAEAVRVCAAEQPDVVLMDVRMPGMDGIEATGRIVAGQQHRKNRQEPSADGPRILILTTFDLDEHVYDALAAGASGFLLKDVTAERLFDAVRVVASGEALLAPTVTRRLIGEFARMRPKPAAAATPMRDRTQAVVAAYESGLVVPGTGPAS
jgi:DNA-binding NarL/FixJ family response regulator